MRTHGTVSKWDEQRGFGFIAPASGAAEVFVHASEFPRDGRRPVLGELVSYEIRSGEDGRDRAVRVMRPGQARAPLQARTDRHGTGTGSAAIVIVLLLVLAIGGYRFLQRGQATDKPARTPVPIAEPASPAGGPFRCDGRTRCPQMHSCAEARYFLQHCPDTKMDGDHDGEPCEQQWCG